VRTLAERWDRFWHQNDVLRVRLTTFRVVFFGLLAFDMWVLMVPHAPRYGANGFNVSHLPFLDAVLPVPTAALVTLLYLVGGFLALRVALGIATRRSVQALTFIYGGVYFWSQADSYQHHYLIALVLLICWFLPHGFLHGVDDGDAAPTLTHVRSWAARLIYVEISVVYFYTALTKTTKYWMNGWAVDQIIQTDSMRGFLAFTTGSLGVEETVAYAFTAHTIMLWQYFVAFAFLVPRLRPLACITGPVFHGLVEVIDLQIGWFSWYMIGLYYILLFPDRWFLAIGRPIARLLSPFGRLFAWLVRPRPVDVSTAAMAAVAAGLVSAALVQAFVPVPAASVTAGILGGLVAYAAWPSATPRPLLRAGLQVAGVAAMVLSLRGTDALYDYHRYWGGDLARRGDLDAAVERYEVANALTAGPARHFQLAELYERLGRVEDARRAWLEGLARDPSSERGRRGLARVGVAP
jgi:hypothetical protein